MFDVFLRLIEFLLIALTNMQHDKHDRKKKFPRACTALFPFSQAVFFVIFVLFYFSLEQIKHPYISTQKTNISKLTT